MDDIITVEDDRSPQELPERGPRNASVLHNPQVFSDPRSDLLRIPRPGDHRPSGYATRSLAGAPTRPPLAHGSSISRHRPALSHDGAAGLLEHTQVGATPNLSAQDIRPAAPTDTRANLTWNGTEAGTGLHVNAEENPHASATPSTGARRKQGPMSNAAATESGRHVLQLVRSTMEDTHHPQLLPGASATRPTSPVTSGASPFYGFEDDLTFDPPRFEEDPPFQPEDRRTTRLHSGVQPYEQAVRARERWMMELREISMDVKYLSSLPLNTRNIQRVEDHHADLINRLSTIRDDPITASVHPTELDKLPKLARMMNKFADKISRYYREPEDIRPELQPPPEGENSALHTTIRPLRTTATGSPHTQGNERASGSGGFPGSQGEQRDISRSPSTGQAQGNQLPSLATLLQARRARRQQLHGSQGNNRGMPLSSITGQTTANVANGATGNHVTTSSGNSRHTGNNLQHAHGAQGDNRGTPRSPDTGHATAAAANNPSANNVTTNAPNLARLGHGQPGFQGEQRGMPRNPNTGQTQEGRPPTVPSSPAHRYNNLTSHRLLNTTRNPERAQGQENAQETEANALILPPPTRRDNQGPGVQRERPPLRVLQPREQQPSPQQHEGVNFEIFHDSQAQQLTLETLAEQVERLSAALRAAERKAEEQAEQLSMTLGAAERRIQYQMDQGKKQHHEIGLLRNKVEDLRRNQEDQATDIEGIKAQLNRDRQSVLAWQRRMDEELSLIHI